MNIRKIDEHNIFDSIKHLPFPFLLTGDMDTAVSHQRGTSEEQ